jgi:hypothetical protein
MVKQPGARRLAVVMGFDTLSHARRLKQAGVPEPQAEAIADATRGLVVQDFATKSDLAALGQRLLAAMDTLGLRLAVRVGVMLAAGFSLATALIGILLRFR